jgi:hypothetical protein
MASNDPNAGNTLGAMIARISDEIGRADLSSQIQNAINDAISIYNQERFYFNETRGETFNGVAFQEFYTSTDWPDIVNLLAIDYMYAFQNGYPYKVEASTPEVLEALTVGGVTSGLPYMYCFYNRQIRIYPMPPDNTYSFRVAGAFIQAPPPDDVTPGNVWMSEAERLIRSRAKYELAVHVLYDTDMAANMGGTSTDADGNPTGGQVGDALKFLRRKTNRMVSMGQGFVKPMHF